MASLTSTTFDIAEMAKAGIEATLRERIINSLIEKTVERFRAELMAAIEEAGVSMVISDIEAFRSVVQMSDELHVHLRVTAPDGSSEDYNQTLR